MLAQDALDQLKSRLKFQVIGEPVGNLTLGRGQWPGREACDVFIAIVENKLASGALGAKECNRLASLFKIITLKKAPLIMYLDSAGARVSEGLPALGAFRDMYRAALDVAESGASTVAICGANCFGGASMLASLAGTRYYSENTRFAMSGPAILAQSNGVSVLDEMFQAISSATIGREGRTKFGAGNLAMSSDAFIAALPAGSTTAARHVDLGTRLERLGKRDGIKVPEKIERRDLEKLYPEGYGIHECDGVLTGEATRDGATIAVLGIIGGQALGAVRAWAFAESARQLLPSPPKTLHVLADCETHATALDDERIMLSAYLADLASALHALRCAGTRIETTVLGKLGGGVYVALCAPANVVNLLHGAEIQLLPGKAIASILGGGDAPSYAFTDYASARVADHELKLGMVN